MSFEQLSEDEKEARFVDFLMDKSDDLDDFVNDAAGYALDYSLGSVGELERYILDQNISFQDASDKALVARSKCWEYLGEVVVRNYNARWTLSDNEENTANRGMFVVVGHSAVAGIEFVPARYVRAFTSRRQPGMLARIIAVDVNPPASVLDDMAVEEE